MSKNKIDDSLKSIVEKLKNDIEDSNKGIDASTTISDDFIKQMNEILESSNTRIKKITDERNEQQIRLENLKNEYLKKIDDRKKTLQNHINTINSQLELVNSMQEISIKRLEALSKNNPEMLEKVKQLKEMLGMTSVNTSNKKLQ